MSGETRRYALPRRETNHASSTAHTIILRRVLVQQREALCRRQLRV